MPDNQQIIKPGASTVTVRQDLPDDVTIGREVATATAAAAAKADIEARIVAALRQPRNMDQFREDILLDCKRPRFAEIALYTKPVGRKKNAETGKWEEAFAVDFSVRFIESALQHFGNYHVISRIEYETAEQVKLVVGVIDVQRNSGFSTEAVIDKLVERKELKQGRRSRGMRENSYGDVVYLVEATKDEVRNLVGAERSKLIRDNGKRLLPRHVLDECREFIDTTLADENAKDPDSAKKKVLDRFAALGISATMLLGYLGRPVETLTAKDLADIAPLYNGLKDGEFTWADVLRTKDEPAEGEAKPLPEKPPLKERLMKPPEQAKQQQPPPPKPETEK
jgi:hypothetical protein